MYLLQEKDWKLYCSKIADWQEAYMAKLLERYIKLLKDEKKPASDRFWKLEDRIKRDKRKPGVTVELSRNNMLMDICRLVKDRAIGLDDLNDFSRELQEEVRIILEMR